MFKFLRNEKKINVNKSLKKYRKYKKSKEYFAELFVRRNCKEATSRMIVNITKIDAPKGFDCRKQQFQSVEFELLPRKTKQMKPKLETIKDKDTIKEIAEALKWQSDCDEIKLRKKDKSKVQRFVIKGEFKKKNPKKKPAMFIESAPDYIKVMAVDVERQKQRDFSEAIQYINPDYLSYDDEKYKVVSVEKTTKNR